MVFSISYHLISVFNKKQTPSFASFDLTRSDWDSVDPWHCVDPHSRPVSYLLTLCQHSSSQNHCFSWVPWGIPREVWRSVMMGSLPSGSVVSPQRISSALTRALSFGLFCFIHTVFTLIRVWQSLSHPLRLQASWQDGKAPACCPSSPVMKENQSSAHHWKEQKTQILTKWERDCPQSKTPLILPVLLLLVFFLLRLLLPGLLG